MKVTTERCHVHYIRYQRFFIEHKWTYGYKKINKKFQRNRFLTPVGMWFMANIRTMNRSILLVTITYGNNKQIYVRWEFQWHEYIVKINFINYFSFHFVLGILLVISSQNEATLQTRHIHRIVKLHNMYRRMFANGAYNVFVADMKKLVINKFKYKMVNGMVNLYGFFCRWRCRFIRYLDQCMFRMFAA
jgi:hypothetical protein